LVLEEANRLRDTVRWTCHANDCVDLLHAFDEKPSACSRRVIVSHAHEALYHCW